MRSRQGRAHASYDSLTGPEWLAFMGGWSPPTDPRQRPRGPWETWQEYLGHWLELRDVALAEWQPDLPVPYAELLLRAYGPEGPPGSDRPTRAALRDGFRAEPPETLDGLKAVQ